MIRHKVKQLDLFIKVIDWATNKYVLAAYMPSIVEHYKLVFSFEDWTTIINDGKQHIYVIAEYMNNKGGVLVKFQDEDWSKLCDKVKEWNDTHKVVSEYVPFEEDDEEYDHHNVLFKDFWDFIIGLIIKVWNKIAK